ncbi:MAG: 3-dehydroquinate synthase, partial [Planctomycetota bacterium]|nr:3-dehydroquinate synthase [Planctomycetota bacterium]
PWAVINDASLLNTLGDRDFVSGFSESVKVSLLKDRRMFDDLCRDAEVIRGRDLSKALPMIRRAALWHLRHITEGGDPFEAREARPLDFGHWSAHKLEVMSDFRLRHGEAVAIGLAIDTVYSSLQHGLDPSDARRVLDCLTALGFPLTCDEYADTHRLFAGMEEFRQHLGGRLTLTMLQGIGDPIDVHQVDRHKMRAAIDQVARYAETPV